VVQDIWTRGFIVPGGEQYAADLMAGCGLNAAETMLEIGVGFGGSTRAVIQRFGNYVTCHERDPALVNEARRQSVEFDVADKLEIIKSNVEKAKFKNGYFRAALLRDTLYTIEGKAMLLERVRNALKRGESQLVITDLMFAQDAAGPELARWMKAESIPVYAYSLEELSNRLSKLGFVIRIAEDESRFYRKMIIDAWKAYLETLNTESLPTEIGRQIVHEAEFWSARIAAIDAGALQYVHVVGVRNS
jgi:ubiquinone/menaquinone biosynthesis C-methylase UbiE